MESTEDKSLSQNHVYIFPGFTHFIFYTQSHHFLSKFMICIAISPPFRPKIPLSFTYLRKLCWKNCEFVKEKQWQNIIHQKEGVTLEKQEAYIINEDVSSFLLRKHMIFFLKSYTYTKVDLLCKKDEA